MRRRNVLQMGAVLAALPIAGCGSSTPDPAAPAAPAGAKGAGEPAAGGSTGAPNAPVAPAPVQPDHAGHENGAPSAAGAADSEKAPPAAPEAPKPELSRVIARLGKNHGHALVVPFADVSAAAEKTYEITAGSSGHKHTVTLSVEQMKGLMDRQIVRTKSTNDRGHEHRVVVRCAPAVDPPEWINACKVTFTGKDEHELIVPAEDLSAKVDKTYDVQGIAGHAHQITITAADFEKLVQGAPVTTKTTREPNDAHLHVVTIEYRPPKKGKAS